jgi:serine/threonine-protein kinase
VVLVLCTVTSFIQRSGEDRHSTYMLLWGGGLGTWVVIFWALRRRGGPVTFVERQIAHVWGMSLFGCILLFFVEMLLGLATLTLSPVIALFSGGVFLIKAGGLSGTFYIQAALLYTTSLVMAGLPKYGIQIFGIVSCVCFFVPGLKHYLRRRRRLLELARVAAASATGQVPEAALQPPARR